MTRGAVMEQRTKETDAELLALAAEGDTKAARRLTDLYLPGVFALAARMLSDAVAAEDVAQEAFLRLWRQGSSWRAEARLSTWLYRVAHNLCIDRIRQHRRTGELGDTEIVDETESVVVLRHRRQVADIVESAIQSLPERQRTAITLVHFEDLGNIEAAEIMNVSVRALESLLARGRRALGAKLSAQKAELLGEEE